MRDIRGSKTKNLEVLMKHFGLMAERVDLHATDALLALLQGARRRTS